MATAKPTPAAKKAAPRAALKAADEIVPALKKDDVYVLIPKPFILTLDDSTTVQYGAGIRPIPRAHAEHWWSKVNGVEIQKD